MPQSRFDRSGTAAEALAAKRAEIAAAVAARQGLGAPAGLAPEARRAVEARVEALIAGQGAPPEDEGLRRCLAEYRDLADTRLAEQSEVFAPQDDA